ncbi:competence/damage-inducible protein A [Halobaculum sp. D14]|uniref:competence/damage-inducible protein A n=1 Tax=unclassified Halobaculum TaxID=2640896 RepID=UPI003EB72C77
MDVAILTVGDELLAGDTENTNASWLARQLTERGASVTRILVVPDDTDVIVEYLREWRDRFDAVVATGGLGGTHDDVTMRAVAEAFDVELTVQGSVLTDVTETARAYAESNPDVVDEYDLDLDLEAWAALPDGARPLDNPAGLAPGCVVGDVYVLPGVPEEMRAVFDGVADEFGGDVTSTALYTPAPEGALTEQLSAANDRFDVAIGSYPSPADQPTRVKVTGTDADEVAAAAAWLRSELDVIEQVGE